MYSAGIHPDVDEATYHADALAPEPSLSSSVARILIDQSPLHAWTAHPRLNPDHQPKTSDAFDIGKAFHTLLLGRGAGVAVIQAEDWRGKDARQERDDARAAGMTPMLEHQYDAAMEMVATAQRALTDARITIERDRAEIAALAQIDGVWCRALVDHAPDSAALPLLDVKTCEDASPEACIRSVTSYGYDVQARWYLDVWKAATGEDRRFRFMFVEKSPPHEVGIYELADYGEGDWMGRAAGKCTEARRIWRECLDAGEWPGYPRHVGLIGAPSYYQQKWDARETGMPVTRASREALDSTRRAQAPDHAWNAQREIDRRNGEPK